MDIKQIKEDKAILERILVAYWISIPSDNPHVPERIQIIRDNPSFFNVDLFKNNVKYSQAMIQKVELDKYLEKIKLLKKHEIDIISRIEKESDEGLI